MASPYVTLYHKKTGEPVFSYACSVNEWLATGDYTTEAPDSPKRPPELAKSKLPSAGREMNRRNPVVDYGQRLSPDSMDDGHQPAEIIEPESEKEEAPKKAPPRRRPRANEG